MGDKEGVGIEDGGISGLVKGGKAGVNAVDFELLDGGWDAGERLQGWEELPVALTMNLVRLRFCFSPRVARYAADPRALADQSTASSRWHSVGGGSHQLADCLLLHKHGGPVQRQANWGGRGRVCAVDAFAGGESRVEASVGGRTAAAWLTLLPPLCTRPLARRRPSASLRT